MTDWDKIFLFFVFVLLSPFDESTLHRLCSCYCHLFGVKRTKRLPRKQKQIKFVFFFKKGENQVKSDETGLRCYMAGDRSSLSQTSTSAICPQFFLFSYFFIYTALIIYYVFNHRLPHSPYMDLIILSDVTDSYFFPPPFGCMFLFQLCCVLLEKPTGPWWWQMHVRMRTRKKPQSYAHHLLRMMELVQ
jgi:hypothetical protein